MFSCIVLSWLYYTHPSYHYWQLLDRTLRVDHVQKYRLPKELLDKEEERMKKVRILCIGGGSGGVVVVAWC